MAIPEIISSSDDLGANVPATEGFFEKTERALAESVSDERGWAFPIEAQGVTQAAPHESFRGFGIND